jgi:threonine/homoserine/homoserine lactone efflux protein
MTAQELAALLAFATAISFTPGPNTTLSAPLAANRGLRHAMPFVAGVPVGWSLMLVGCALGLGALIDAAPGLRGALQAFGIAYLLWLAWQLVKTRTLAQADKLAVGFGRGIALQFVNIKAWMAALTVSAGWIAVSGQTVTRLTIVLPLMIAYALASNFAYALVGSLLRPWLARGRRLVWFNRAMAAVLATTAAWMAVL